MVVDYWCRVYTIRAFNGTTAIGRKYLLFDLKAGQEFEKSDTDAHGKKQRSSILTGWDGTFGPTFGKNHSSLHVDTFDGYTYFSIKEGAVQDNARQPEAGPGSENEEKTE